MEIGGFVPGCDHERWVEGTFERVICDQDLFNDVMVFRQPQRDFAV
jgi:hypothetical protein